MRCLLLVKSAVVLGVAVKLPILKISLVTIGETSTFGLLSAYI